MPAPQTAPGSPGPDRAAGTAPGRAALMVWRIAYVRSRFFLVLAGAFAVVANWEALSDRWDRLTRAARGPRARDRAASPDAEYWCPMCPGVVSDRPAKCPVCKMSLVWRLRGEPVPSADGVLERMQFSPYRVELAGIRTAAVAYRPLVYEVLAGGFIREAPAEGDGSLVGMDGVDAAGRSRLGLDADVSEKGSALLAEGQRVELTCDAAPGRTVEGRVLRLTSRPTPVGRAARVWVAVLNPPHGLWPGTYATARIRIPAHRVPWLSRAPAGGGQDRTIVEPTGSPGPRRHAIVGALLGAIRRELLLRQGLVLSVPESAVIDTGSRKVVYVEAGTGMFTAAEVAVGPRCGGFLPVLRGLEEGQRVAITGAILLDAEARLDPALASTYFGATRAPVPESPVNGRASGGLSPAAGAAVARQGTCPVTGRPLGSMGTPVPAEVAGRVIYLCCAGCEPELRDHPDRYLSRLPAPPRSVP